MTSIQIKMEDILNLLVYGGQSQLKPQLDLFISQLGYAVLDLLFIGVYVPILSFWNSLNIRLTSIIA